mgnify:CR=1 FL=1
MNRANHAKRRLTYPFKAFRSSDLYFLTNSSLRSRHPRPFIWTGLFSVVNKLERNSAMSYQSSGFVGRRAIISLQSAMS